MELRIPSTRDWIQAAIAGRDLPDLQTDAVEIEALAHEEGVLALLASACSARDNGCLSGLREALHVAAMRQAALELDRMAQARRVLSALADAGVEALVLKGAALAYWLYDAPAQRPRCDMDVLVASQAEAARAVTALIAVGFSLAAEVGVEASAEYEIALVRRSTAGSLHTVDLHWRLLNHAALARGLGFEELWSHSIPIPKLHARARGLGRVHALVHALLHRVTNVPSGKHNRLVWLYDIHLLAGGCDADGWRSLLDICASKAIATPCLDGLRASRIAFSTAIPTGIETDLQAIAVGEKWKLDASLDQGTMDRAHLRALSWPAKIGWLGRKLFPSVEFMRYRYGASGVAGLMRAYLQRWWVGLRRGLGG